MEGQCLEIPCTSGDGDQMIWVINSGSVGERVMVTVRGHSGDVCVLVPDNQIHKLTEFLARSLEAHQLRDRKLPKDGVTLICRSGDGVELQFYPFYGKHPCCMVNVRDKVNGWFLLSITDVPRLIQFLG